MKSRDKIIEFIRSNRVSTTEVADALGKKGALTGILPITPDCHEVGVIRCIFASNGSNFHVHDQIRNTKQNEIVLIFAHNCEDKAVIGELVSKFCLLYQNNKAIVVDGLVRDIAAIKRQKMKVWSKGTTPIGCVNRDNGDFPFDLKEQLLAKYEGAVAVCDDGGVVIIDNENLNELTLSNLINIEIQEDIWFFCLDTLKWDTKKIVCDKAYLEEDSLLSKVHIEQLKGIKDEADKH